jgi:hypothetical protein
VPTALKIKEGNSYEAKVLFAYGENYEMGR